MAEQTHHESLRAKIFLGIRVVLFPLLEPTITISLLAVAMVEALLSPFLGWHLALASLATAAVGIGLNLMLAGFWIEHLTSLQGEQGKQTATPEKPLPSWKN